MAEELFVYGTLHPDRAPAEIADLTRKFRLLGTGTIRGKLYDLGDFPGVIVSANCKKKVSGSVFGLPDNPETLASLDRYEDFHPDDPDNSLFIRAKRTVTLDRGRRRRCWVYLYNGQLPSAS